MILMLIWINNFIQDIQIKKTLLYAAKVTMHRYTTIYHGPEKKIYVHTIIVIACDIKKVTRHEARYFFFCTEIPYSPVHSKNKPYLQIHVRLF